MNKWGIWFWLRSLLIEWKQKKLFSPEVTEWLILIAISGMVISAIFFSRQSSEKETEADEEQK
ncbi:hypothetical protein Plim_3072 [Planctopirus limnophila DSM 3776]|uniref:Uncharacterized protein n=1 Tax=Planctopirus limnophila (strain ATCC 43296 / DSM 3776 / IFAM 1008 / Mu 290) TaxID=521674 RepID=D5SSU0_PLAL2|nr:hypothetical protein Plim_3072 [Planctopirus limnophila DSM 3776]